jgi:hypothetical protein
MQRTIFLGDKILWKINKSSSILPFAMLHVLHEKSMAGLTIRKPMPLTALA